MLANQEKKGGSQWNFWGIFWVVWEQGRRESGGCGHVYVGHLAGEFCRLDGIERRYGHLEWGKRTGPRETDMGDVSDDRRRSLLTGRTRVDLNVRSHLLQELKLPELVSCFSGYNPPSFQISPEFPASGRNRYRSSVEETRVFGTGTRWPRRGGGARRPHI